MDWPQPGQPGPSLAIQVQAGTVPPLRAICTEGAIPGWAWRCGPVSQEEKLLAVAAGPLVPLPIYPHPASRRPSLVAQGRRQRAVKATDAYRGCRGWQRPERVMQRGAALSHRVQEAHITTGEAGVRIA